MKYGIIVFPGSNCDRDMQDALQNELNKEVIMLWHKDKDISMFSTADCIVLPGGFSYGDYLRCGAIARFSPMMQSVIDFANRGGKVLGVCNGFQIRYGPTGFISRPSRPTLARTMRIGAGSGMSVDSVVYFRFRSAFTGHVQWHGPVNAKRKPG